MKSSPFTPTKLKQAYIGKTKNFHSKWRTDIKAREVLIKTSKYKDYIDDDYSSNTQMNSLHTPELPTQATHN